MLWTILSFKAGFINAGGFLATGRFVSHITGFGTQIGLSLAHDDYFFGFELLAIPLFFILGATVAGWFLDESNGRDEIPNYAAVQFIITFLLGVVFYLGSSGLFGRFEHLNDTQKDIILIALLCFVCGLKNGLTTWATHGKIRTTHLTGLATDIGLHLPKIFRGKKLKSRFPEPSKVNLVRLITLVSFSVGSCLAAFVFPIFEYQTFGFAFAISVCLLFISLVHQQKLLNKKIKENS